MVIFTETMAKLVKELAELPGTVETEVTEGSVSIRFCGGPGRIPAKTAKRTGGDRKGANGHALKTYEFHGESLTAAEWAERYGVSEKIMRQRLSRGSPETGARKSKLDNSSLKAKLLK